MRITGSCRYAVAALVHLAESGGQPCTSHAIAQTVGIPETFLRKLLWPLVAAQLLYSLRGPRGGYQLSRPAGKISLAEVVEALEGPIRGDATPWHEADTLDQRLQRHLDRVAQTWRRHLAKLSITDLMRGGRRN
jgi:Rrf2 family protein